MAKAIEAPKPKGGFPLVAILVATIIGAGAGGFFGLKAPSLVGTDHAGKGAADSKDTPELSKFTVRNLPPVTTNLSNPPNTWIRLETAVLVKLPIMPDTEALLGKIAEDLVAYLRTVPLEQIEGPAGFQHLREDLNDRLRARSEGKVTEIIIQTLVVE